MAEDNTSGETFKPLVKLEEVEVDSGEKNEEVLYTHRCKVYRFHENEWKERGLGDVKLLKHTETQRVRVVMRQEKTLKVVVNHLVSPHVQLTANSGSDRSWVWTATDYSDGLDGEVTTFAIRFKSPEIASDFKDSYVKAQECNSATSDESKTQEPAADAEKEETESPWGSILRERKFSPLQDEDVKALWEKYDTDGSQSLDSSELRNLLSDLVDAVFSNFKVDAADELVQLVKDDLDNMTTQVMTELDTNADGKVSFTEFQALKSVQGTQFAAE